MVEPLYLKFPDLNDEDPSVILGGVHVSLEFAVNGFRTPTLTITIPRNPKNM